MMTDKQKTVFSIIGFVLSILTIIYVILKVFLWHTLSPTASSMEGADIIGGLNYLFYFTTISNLLVSIWLICWAINTFTKKEKYRFVKDVYLQACTTCYILVTMFVYWVFGVSLLGFSINESVLPVIINFHLHLIMPIFFITLWFFPMSAEQLDNKKAIKFVLYPLVYGIVVEIKGNIDGWYPYPFLDSRELWSMVFKQEFNDIGAIFLVASACCMILAIAYIFSLLVIKVRNSQIEYKRRKGAII